MPKLADGDRNPPPKKKVKGGKQYKNDQVQLNQVLTLQYVGKRILLTAASLFGRKIPKGEEELLFQYHIGAVNSDSTTSTIEYGLQLMLMLSSPDVLINRSFRY
jgi:hypothetical protein